jgi:hypothetical protein
MKGLKQFTHFDAPAFFKDKTLVALGVTPAYEYLNGERTEKVIATKIETVIGRDATQYNSEITNTYEKLNIKVVDDLNYQISPMTKIKIMKFEKAVVYGQFQNQLSIEVLAENIKVIQND